MFHFLTENSAVNRSTSASAALTEFRRPINRHPWSWELTQSQNKKEINEDRSLYYVSFKTSQAQIYTRNNPKNSQWRHDTCIQLPSRKSSLGSTWQETKKLQKVLRCIEKAEVIKVCYKLLSKYLKPSTQGGITTPIEVASKDGTTWIVTEPSKIST